MIFKVVNTFDINLDLTKVNINDRKYEGQYTLSKDVENFMYELGKKYNTKVELVKLQVEPNICFN